MPTRLPIPKIKTQNILIKTICNYKQNTITIIKVNKFIYVIWWVLKDSKQYGRTRVQVGLAS